MNEIVQFADETEWKQAVVAYHNKAMRSQWEFAIVLREGLDKFGWHDKKKDELIDQICQQIDLRPSYVKKIYFCVKSQVAKIALGLGISFQHALVSYDNSLDISYLESLMTQAAEWQWGADKLRFEIQSYKYKSSNKELYNLPLKESREDEEPEPLIIPPSRQSDTRALHELVSSVNRDKVFTYTGAQALPIAMTPKEHYAMAVYGRATGDMINWTRGDHYNRMLRDAKLKGRREGWTQEKLQAHVTDELAQLATDYQCSAVTILLNAATALAFSGTRQESAVIGYAHHELLRNSSSEEAADWLTRAERNRWTPEQLDAQMHPHRSNDDIIINIIKGVQGIQLDEQAITLTSAHGKLIIKQWRIEQ